MARLSVGAKVAIFVGALVLVGAAALVISLATLRQSAALYRIPSVAMAPTLLPGDRIIASKRAYRTDDPQRGDVVVFRVPRNAHRSGTAEVWVKRVVAIPGDTVRITRGYVLIGSDEFDHSALRHLLQQLSRVKIANGRVFEDGKPVPDSEIAYGANAPGQPVRVEDSKSEGRKRVVIGPEDAPIMTLDEDQLSQLLQRRHFVKLVGSDIYRDGKKIDVAKLAELAGSSKARVRVAPGVVYLNGRALSEPYTAEDPDGPYPGDPRSMIKPEWMVTHKIGKERVHLVRIPKGKLLVMGDNRNDSNDSRFWGLLDRDRVIGKVTSILAPENRAGPVRSTVILKNGTRTNTD